jgi:DNA-binding transcriptional MerR regulator/methylmalonyl-CoA mutase cobalamin-binding subunit
MTNAKHSIGAVAKRTGLSTYVIRVWEKRYRAIEPDRTETRRRLFSDREIERLILLKKATEMGESIGQISSLSDEVLKKLVGDSSVKISSTFNAPDDAGIAIDYLDKSLDAVRSLDATGLESILNDAAIAVSKPVLLERILGPLMYKIGDLWRDGQLKVVHEHLASAVVRTFLGNLASTYRPSQNAPAIVVTTPVGQWHEFGALMAVIAALRIGWRAIYLGPNIPADEIASAVKSNGARAVALSLIYPADDPDIERELVSLRKYVGGQVAIYVGGRAAANYTEVIRDIGAIAISKLTDFQRHFDLSSTFQAK